MKRYKVVFAASAKIEIAASFEWGRKYWGEQAAKNWYRTLKGSVRKSLSVVPLAQPIAPENSVYAAEIRKMFLGRYRAVFSVEKLALRILHVRGAFVDSTQRPFEDEE